MNKFKNGSFKFLFKFLFLFLGIEIMASLIPTSRFIMGIIKDPNLLWLEFEMAFRMKVICSVILSGIIGNFIGIKLRSYKSLLMSEQEISKSNAGWKWMLFNDLFVLELILFFYTAFILYILILQENQENIQVEILRLIDITYPLWFVLGLANGDFFRKYLV